VKSIYHYFDYRKYLKDTFDEKCNSSPRFTLRHAASKMGINHSHLVRILAGKKHLTVELAPAVSRLLKHTPKQRKYFTLMVLFGRAKTEKDISGYFKDMVYCSGAKSAIIEADKYEFYQRWYYTAIREALGLIEFDGTSYTQLAHLLHPSISAKEAKEAVLLLKRLGLIKKNSHGVYRSNDRFITTGEKIQGLAVASFHKEMIELAKGALDTVERNDRDFSTVTVTVSEEKAHEIKAALARCRNEILTIAEKESQSQRVYHINLQLYPLTRKN